jgi:hypothetical protein
LRRSMLDVARSMFDSRLKARWAHRLKAYVPQATRPSCNTDNRQPRTDNETRCAFLKRAD